MTDFLDRLFTSAAPLILASIGALYTELAGTLGIFVEGFMNTGAFFAWILAGWTGSALYGTFVSACAAGLGGWGLARLVRKTHANPFIAGLAVNVAAGGITSTLSVLLFGTKGVLRDPHIAIPGRITIPVIQDIPGLGPVLSGHSFSVYLSWGVLMGAVFFLEKTSWGMRLKASGLSPEAAKERGIRPGLYWEGAWGAAAFLAATAGALLCFRVGAYTPGAVAGRGWISIAAVYLGFRTVGGVFAASLGFALADRLSQSLQGFGGVSSTAILGLPHALALILYTLSQWIRNRRIRRP
ncbi:MAG: ABC transporter permease [Spirochaetaceae bacterium]|jgi:simple sugar transport system permease protein|nr:ABC transporter permease [Spirochaetaceae bacterium]